MTTSDRSYGMMATELMLAPAIAAGMQLDRAQTKRLLRQLESMDSAVPGCAIMQAQLRAVLARRDWLLISITADAATLPKVGVGIGIALAAPPPRKARKLSPLQKWQQANGLDRRRR